MDGDSTDEESATSGRPAASSSSAMAPEEIQVLRRLQQRVSNISSLVRVCEVHKPVPGKTWIVCQVSVSPPDGTIGVRISHDVDPMSGESYFSVSSESTWLEDFCNNAPVPRSLNAIIELITDAVEQRRLAVLMDSLRIEHAEIGSESSEGSPTMSSGTTAASPQSSRSTTTSLPG